MQVRADRNPDRVQQDTVASQARKEASSDGLALKALHELRTVMDAEVYPQIFNSISFENEFNGDFYVLIQD